MRATALLRLGALMALAVTTLSAAAVRVNTWSACALDAAPDGFPSLSAQCTNAVVPLCAGGICTDPDGQTINLYLKRIVASNSNVKPTARNVWVVPDRSDYTLPSEVDTQLQRIYRQLGGDASVYTLDQRGTGRSSRVACDLPRVLSAAAVQRCAQALSVVVGSDLAAFSLTSAAYDLVSLITLLHAKTDVFVYGLGYGTLVVERLLHFGVAAIRGYILDGVTTTSGAKKSAFAYISKADAAFAQVGDAFLSQCAADVTCSRKFTDKSIALVLDTVLARLDDASIADDANCASVLVSASSQKARASDTLRRALAAMMQNVTERAFIPVVIYRLARCTASDRSVLTPLLGRLTQRLAQLEANREVVHDVIAFSELWEAPSAIATTLTARFTDASISAGRVVDDLGRYCLFTGDTTDACTANSALPTNRSPLTNTPNASRLAYERDAFWNAPATIPATASVLLLSSDVDGQAPTAYAQALKDALVGTAKELLTFHAAGPNVLATATLRDSSASCGLAVLESYVSSRGDLTKYDTSCLDALPVLSFALAPTTSTAVLGVANAYDGDLAPLTPLPSQAPLDSSHSSDADSDVPYLRDENATLRKVVRRYRVVFITVVALLLVLLVVLALVLLRAWREKQYRDELLRLDGLRRGPSDADAVDASDYYAITERRHTRYSAASADDTIHYVPSSKSNSRSSSDGQLYAVDLHGHRPLDRSSSEYGDVDIDRAMRPPHTADSVGLDWNFRSHTNHRGGGGDDLLPPPPFSDYTYSSSNHLRL